MTPDGGLHEFGYLAGHWGNFPCSGADQTTFYSKPRLFSFRTTVDGSMSCKFLSDRLPPKGTQPVFRIDDANRDKRWLAYYNNVNLQSTGVLMDFLAGTVVVSMERGSPTDTGAADFRAIHEYHQSNGWTRTENIHRACDWDHDWMWVPISGSDGKTVATQIDATTCA